ncbi:MAG: hypothetical protein ABWZ25_01470 [Chitinophagaceae bacterium]
MANTSFMSNGPNLAQFETPFADSPGIREFVNPDKTAEEFFSDFFKDVDSPFSRTYESSVTSNSTAPASEEYVDLLAELQDGEFRETLYEMADELEDTWRNKVSDEITMGHNFMPFATQQAREYFAPVVRETESMIDRIAEHFSGNNLSDQSGESVEMFFETLEFNHGQYTPAQEQFFGKIFKKVQSVVKKGVDLAKKGVAAVGKLMPINIVLKKLKGLIKPLLDKVLKFAIGKLPNNLQPHARTLAKKFLKLEAEFENTNDTVQSEDLLEVIQTEFDNHITQLMFSRDDEEAENTIINYESSDETLERLNNYETGQANGQSLAAARQQFINELNNLQQGESPAPAIERFLPAAIMALQPVIKIAISLIGRQKVINFLAGLLAKLVGKYVDASVAQPLAAGIIDIGMSAIGFEVHETGKTNLAYEAIANTIEETIQSMTNLNENALNDTEELTMELLQAFEQAAANNFPPQYIKEELRKTKQKAVWVAMPRNLPVKFYKKFTHVYDISIDPQTALAVTTFRSLPLANFLKDKYGLDTSKPVKAKVHLYEITRGGRLSQINKFEKLPGLNAKQPKAWVQILPLTKQAASLLLKEPSLGKDITRKGLANRFKAEAGQRFYYLEIEGVRLRIPPVNRFKHKRGTNLQPATITESRSADIQGVINFIKSEIKINYYFSEEDAKEVVEKLNKKDFLGAALSIRQSVKNVLNDILVKNISTKVKIVHEAIPELYLEHYPDQQENFAPLQALGKVAGKEIISKLVEKLTENISAKAYEAISNFFKARAAEFKDAQAQPQDGVTVKLTWYKIPGMSAIRSVINAIRGNLTVGNLTDISLPSLSVPDIKVAADKQFN